eukprot:SAG11_NODE_127_length_15677_cov_10.890872_9_plen_52_part_00
MRKCLYAGIADTLWFEKNAKPLLVLTSMVFESLLIRHHVLDACDEGIGSGS